MDDSLYERMAAQMAAQHGAISAEQLDGLGMTRAQVRTHIRQGRLQRVAPGVFGSPAVPETIDFRRHVGLLALGDGAVISHRAAATLHRFDRCQPDVVEFTVLRASRNAALPFPVHSTMTLPRIDRVVVDGYPCTSATRTIIDLARLRVGTLRLEAAIDTAVRTGRSSPVVIIDRLSALRGRGRWGARLLDELMLDSGGHTMLERRFLGLMRKGGLPRPRTQVIFRRDGKTYARVDFMFDEQAIVVEVSGRKGHTSPSERARDAQRRNELQDAGRLVYEYTWEHVIRDGDMVIDTMRSRLGSRSLNRSL